MIEHQNLKTDRELPPNKSVSEGIHKHFLQHKLEGTTVEISITLHTSYLERAENRVIIHTCRYIPYFPYSDIKQMQSLQPLQYFILPAWLSLYR